jgi:hypothetical protein
VETDNLRPSSFKNDVALEPMGPSDSSAMGMNMRVVERVAYLVSFRDAADSAAAAAVTDVDDR